MLERVLAGPRAYGPALWWPSLPERRFVLYNRGRSGSTLLLDLVRSHDQVACDGEILGAPVRFPSFWVRAHAARAAHGGATTYGFKVLTNDLTQVQGMTDPTPFLRGLDDRGYRIIWLWRRNLLRHAVSWLQGMTQQTHYHSEAERRAAYKAVVIEPEAVVSIMFMGEKMAVDERAYLADLPHLELVYEDDLEDPARHQATADRIYDFLGLPAAEVRSTLVRSSPRHLSESIENYDEVAALVRHTRFAHFLDEGSSG